MNLVQLLQERGIEGAAELKLKHKRHKKYENLVLFRYDQLNSSFKNAAVTDARGIVLDEKNDWRIVVFPYEKFFNFNESFAAKLDWDAETVVTEKSDGSLMTLYYYDGAWQVASQGMADASGKLTTFKEGRPRLSHDEHARVLTYADAFWRIWAECGYQLPGEAHRSYCFMFELTLCDSIIVVAHKRNSLVLHGCRNLATLAEERPDGFALQYNWELVHRFTHFKSLEEVIEASKQLNGLEQEGYVCCDKNFKRVKVKCPMYVSLSLLRGSTDDVDMKRRILTIVQANEGEEFLNYFPTYRDIYFEQKGIYDRLIEFMTLTFDEHFANLPEKRLIGAVAAEKNVGFVALIYRLYDKQTTVLEFVSKLPLATLETGYLFPFIEHGCIPMPKKEEKKKKEKKKAKQEGNDTV